MRRATIWNGNGTNMCGKPNGTLWIGASRENVLQSGGASQSSGAPWRKRSKIRAAWEEKLQKPGSLRSRLEEMRESRRDSGRTRESSTGSRAAAGRLLQPSFTLSCSSAFGWIRAQNEHQQNKTKNITSSSCLISVLLGVCPGGVLWWRNCQANKIRETPGKTQRAECLLSFISKTCLQHFCALKKCTKINNLPHFFHAIFIKIQIKDLHVDCE